MASNAVAVAAIPPAAPRAVFSLFSLSLLLSHRRTCTLLPPPPLLPPLPLSLLSLTSNFPTEDEKANEVPLSSYRGVFWHKVTRRWYAKIAIPHQSCRLGYFADDVSAAKAYDYAAREFLGTLRSEDVAPRGAMR